MDVDLQALNLCELFIQQGSVVIFCCTAREFMEFQTHSLVAVTLHLEAQVGNDHTFLFLFTAMKRKLSPVAQGSS